MRRFPRQEMDKPPKWFTTNEIHHWLICHRYSEEIATELAEVIATKLQEAFEKGWAMAAKHGQAVTYRHVGPLKPVPYPLDD